MTDDISKEIRELLATALTVSTGISALCAAIHASAQTKDNNAFL
jgi:hypothetical protein